jgi:hypothetical protein
MCGSRQPAVREFFPCADPNISHDHPKVPPDRAEKASMEHDQEPLFESDDPHFLHARALSLSVGAIRKAQGKVSPNDFPVGSIEWHAAVEDFANDVLIALLGEPDNADIPPGHFIAKR